MDSSLQIVVETKTKKCIDKCIICQKPKDNKGNKKLTSTANGRSTVIEFQLFFQIIYWMESKNSIKSNIT